MASKYCPRCGRIASTNSIPNYCPWGCGSLKDEPILPDYKNWDERLKMIEDLKAKYEAKPLLKMEEIKPGAFQIKLF